MLLKMVTPPGSRVMHLTHHPVLQRLGHLPGPAEVVGEKVAGQPGGGVVRHRDRLLRLRERVQLRGARTRRRCQRRPHTDRRRSRSSHSVAGHGEGSCSRRTTSISSPDQSPAELCAAQGGSSDRCDGAEGLLAGEGHVVGHAGQHRWREEVPAHRLRSQTVSRLEMRNG